jgi:integrase
MAHDQPLFPKLKRRRTWLMVKLDLERIGIPYTTAEGDADFHAAGRHTYITRLIRSGVSLSVTKQLARHADVNMTMRYTHHGLGEQANALASMPVPPLGISEQKEAHKSNEADIPKIQED